MADKGGVKGERHPDRFDGWGDQILTGMPGAAGKSVSIDAGPGRENAGNRTRFTRLAFILIGTGILAAIESHTGIPLVSRLWPLLPLILGVGLIGIFIKRKTGSKGLLASGEYLICFSGLALYCSLTSWENISRFWPLFIGFLGIVFFTVFLLDRQRRILSFLGVWSVSLSAIFYSVFMIDIRFWWTSFVLTGLSVLVSVRIK